jgi:excisionase family DNA binding protein
MRMDEYQKWLEAQFLDDEGLSEESPQPMAVVHEVVDAAPQEAPQPVLAFGSAELQDAELHSSLVLEPSRPADTTIAPQAAHIEEPVAESPNLPFRATTATSADSHKWVQDAEVPSIENYLPFLRDIQAGQAPPLGEAAPSDSEVDSQMAVSEILAESTTGDAAAPKFQTEADTAGVQSDELSQPSERVAGLVDSVTPKEILQAERHPDIEDDTSSAPIPAARGRRARNVDINKSIEPLQVGSLWTLVPKHIQILVAMGSDDDVVQNSYKRSFKESRIELIDKLLDPTLSLEDAARLLSVCPTTVRRYTNKGLLTHQRTTGDQRRFKLSDVLAFLEAQSTPIKRTSNRPS